MQEFHKKHFWLYVLKLENDKWYVGITSRTPEHRFKQHMNGFGANWTRNYKPIKIHYTQDLGYCSIENAQLFEGRVTRKYMEKYGDNNVRGGDLTDTDEYLRRFGYYITKENWQVITVVVMLMLMIVYLLLDKYFL